MELLTSSGRLTIDRTDVVVPRHSKNGRGCPSSEETLLKISIHPFPSRATAAALTKKKKKNPAAARGRKRGRRRSSCSAASTNPRPSFSGRRRPTSAPSAPATSAFSPAPVPLCSDPGRRRLPASIPARLLRPRAPPPDSPRLRPPTPSDLTPSSVAARPWRPSAAAAALYDPVCPDRSLSCPLGSQVSAREATY